MPRTETKIMDGWQFALGKECPEREAFQAVALPHDWAISMPIEQDMPECEPQGFYNRWSIGWYRKSIRLDEKKKDYVYYLAFDGIMENSTVWVNGQEAGGRHYGYSAFRLDVTPFVQSGQNDILIRVDNTAVPADRWYSGCGIYRTVKWLEVPQNHLDAWEVAVSASICGDVTVQTGTHAPVKATLRERNTGRQVMAEGVRTIGLHMENPLLWSAEEPNLYDLELTLLDETADTISTTVGIREIQFLGDQGMLVNGKREILQGVCIHQDIACRGIATKKELWYQRLLALKEMGCNAVRPAHQVFGTEFLDLCDELGFYVYDECFDKWEFGAYQRNFKSQWQRDVDAMVKRDRNHPCVIIWGVGNEETNQGQTAMLDNLKMLYDYVKELDATRPVSYAMKPHFMRDGDPADDLVVREYADRMPYIKKIGEIVDVVCCNYMDQWYPAIHEMLPDKLIIGTEVYQYFAGHPDQMQNFEQKVPSLVPQQLPYCIGSFIWTGIDYLGESIGYPFRGRGCSPLRTNHSRRPMYYAFQSWWKDEPMVRFSVVDYTVPDEGTKWHWNIPPFAEHWDFPQFKMQPVPYMIASNCEEVKLYLNGNPYLLPKPAECPNRMIMGYLPYLPGTVEVVGYRDGKAVCNHKVVTPASAAKLAFCQESISVPAEDGYEQLISVQALDEAGNPVFREGRPVEFSLEAGGQILAVDNGDLSDLAPYHASTCKLYRGQASVLLRMNGTPGQVILRAEAPGLTDAQINIIVE